LCTKEDDICPFINVCDIVINLVEEKFVSMLVEFIITNISGKPLEKIRYKDVSKCEFIKGYLTDVYEGLTTASNL